MAEQEFHVDNTIRLAERMVRSESFNHLYDEGMSLVEEAASYLDGEGPRGGKALVPHCGDALRGRIDAVDNAPDASRLLAAFAARVAKR